ncbi:MAG: M15 family metallopeptidase [Anaerolineae bacterium]|nr:M15 family metallopeptidase [Anaerolineae bacterium]
MTDESPQHIPDDSESPFERGYDPLEEYIQSRAQAEAELPPPAPETSRGRRVLWIGVQLAAILLAVVGTYLGFRQGAIVEVKPTLEPLPTYSVSDELQAQIAAAAVGQASPFTCPRNLDIGPVEIATCTDCMYYPVDRLHTLPSTYVPTLVRTELPGGGMVRTEVKTPLTDLFTAARAAGYSAVVTSAYRSYDEQVRTFASWVSFEINNLAAAKLDATTAQGIAILRAAQYSARAGHSEHQLGTVVDLNCAGCVPFDRGAGGNIGLWKFFEENAHLYGFIISYPRGIEALTGYQYEPWHLRYVGVDYATQLFNAGYLTGNGVCPLKLLSSVEKG